MINNDVMRSIRYMLDLGDSKVVDIIQLADPQFGKIDTGGNGEGGAERFSLLR